MLIQKFRGSYIATNDELGDFNIADMVLFFQVYYSISKKLQCSIVENDAILEKCTYFRT